MGNVAVAIVQRGPHRGRYVTVADFTGSSSYATNGDTIQAADIAALMPELNDLTAIVETNFEESSAGHHCYLDKTNKKLKFFNGTTEITNTTDLHLVTVRGTIRYGGKVGPV